MGAPRELRQAPVLRRTAFLGLVLLALAGAPGTPMPAAEAQPASGAGPDAGSMSPESMGPSMMGQGMMGQGMTGQGMTGQGMTRPGPMERGMMGHDTPENAAPTGAATSGARIFASQCSLCHALQANAAPKAGPNLWGVFGRKAGSLHGFTYSAAMRDSNVVWTPSTLDAFLAAPDRFLPGTAMAYPGLATENERSALITYLKEAGE